MASRSRLIAINGSAGALTTILATGPTASFEVREDDLAAATGFAYYSAEDGFTNLNTLASGSEPLQIPNTSRYPMQGPIQGINVQGIVGAFNYRAADTLLKAIGKGAGATTLRFIEND